MRATPLLIGMVVLSSVAPVLAQGYREPARTLSGAPSSRAVSRVIDGDTVQCADGRRIRLRGVDTPERGEAGCGSCGG